MPNVLDKVLLEIGLAISPLLGSLRSPEGAAQLLSRLGWSLPPGVAEIGLVGAPIEQVIERLDVVLTSTAADLDDELLMATRFVELGSAIASLIDSVEQIAKGVPSTLSGVGDYVTRTRIDKELLPRLLDFVVVNHISHTAPIAFALLRAATIIEFRAISADPVNHVTAHVRHIVHYDRIGMLLSAPERALAVGYGWATATFSAERLLANLGLLLATLGGSAQFRPLSRKAEEAILGRAVPEADVRPAARMIVDLWDEAGLFGGTKIGVALYEVRQSHAVATDAGIGVMPIVRGAVSASIPLKSDSLLLDLAASAEMTDGVNLILRPGQAALLETNLFTGGGPAGPGVVGAELRYLFDNTMPRTIAAIPGVLELRVRELSFAAGVDGELSGAGFDTFADLSLRGLRIAVDSALSDSFVASLLSGADIAGVLDLNVRWGLSSGLALGGTGGLEIAIPMHQSLGFATFETLHLILKIGDDGSLSLETSTGITGQLGPMAATLDRMGAEIRLGFSDGAPVDFAVAFRPPSRVGLSIDASVVKGGGYLDIDSERGEYAGMLELVFSEFIGVTAIGLISTRLPDGSKGFSLLIIITADFGLGIQLGLGFTLLAVGGLLGLNRTVKVMALTEGVRTGALNSVLFPKNVVANAPRIISDLRRIFPPKDSTFLIGPMAKIGWGVPTLISVALGVIIEPGKIVILGALRVVLPTEDAAIIRLQVHFIGAIEFDRKRIYFFAGLFDSRVVFSTIEGEMALLLAFGSDAGFVLSVGGFHPRFDPPPLPVPTPTRVSIDLVNLPAIHFRVEGYFAVTTNSVQFGARVELRLGFDDFGVSGHLAFDVLFQFSPFFFSIQISASFSVKVFGFGLFSVHIRGLLEGPTPYRISGRGKIKVLFFSFSVGFNTSWGEHRETRLPPIAVMPLLKEELLKPANWTAQLPARNNILVSLRDLPDEEALVLHPVGVLRVTQRLLPLNLKLNKVGNQRPSDVNRLSIDSADSDLSKIRETREKFAIGQFKDLSDGEKLSRPAFQPQEAGLELSAGGQELRSSHMVRRTVRFEQIIIDTNFRRFVNHFFGIVASVFEFFGSFTAVASSNLSVSKKVELPPDEERIVVIGLTFTVALQSDNSPLASDVLSFASEASAADYMDRAIARNPNLEDALHVIPSYERNAA